MKVFGRGPVVTGIVGTKEEFEHFTRGLGPDETKAVRALWHFEDEPVVAEQEITVTE